jgi:hypothetical protein
MKSYLINPQERTITATVALSLDEDGNARMS